MFFASRFSLLLLFGLALLAGCGQDAPSSPRLDLVSVSGLQTDTRTVSPGDTLITRAYAEAGDNEPALARFTVTVAYSQWSQNKLETAAPYTYLDTLLPTTASAETRSFLWEQHFNASTESGQELWTFSVHDLDGNSASRRFRLTTNQADSALEYHTYTVRLQAPTNRSKVAALAAARGLALSSFATRQPDMQALVDLLYVPDSAGNARLATPTATATLQNGILGVSRWNAKRATQLASTTLNATNFTNTNTASAISTAVGNATLAPNFRSAALATNNVLAFRTADGKDGLLLVSSISAKKDLNLTVKIRR